MDSKELIVSLWICLSPFWDNTLAEINTLSEFCLQYIAIGDNHEPFNFRTKSLSASARIRSFGELIVFKISKTFSFDVKHSTPI